MLPQVGAGFLLETIHGGSPFETVVQRRPNDHNFPMLVYPEIDPVIFSLGPLKIRWYGMMYLLGFTAAWGLATVRARTPGSGWSRQQVEDLLFYSMIGVILGGRLGSVLFYRPQHYLNHPLDIFKIWEGGMAFHGGLLGVMAALWLFSKKHDKEFFRVTDFVVPLVPIGLGLGRIGNFINGELWGRVTDSPFGMVFPHVGPLPRHPSQLYQAALEGVALFVILWLFSGKSRPKMAVSGAFLLGYGLFRFWVEFAREPDANLGFIAGGWLTMGQLLSLPMAIAGVLMLGWAYRSREAPGG